MSLGGTSVATRPTYVHHLRVSDSQIGVVIPFIYGRARVPTHLLWQGDWTAVAHTGSGKGLGQPNAGTFYTYTVSYLNALCAGPITAVGRHFVTGSFGVKRVPAVKVYANNVIKTGELGQAPWSYLVSRHPGIDIGYTGIAYVARANADLGTNPTLPQSTFEVFGKLPYSTAILDADPSAVINDIISNPVYGMVPNATWVDSVTFADLTEYVLANGFFLSPVFDQQKPGRDWLSLLLETIHADAVWSEGQLRVVPYSTESVTGNSQVWMPNLTPVANFSDDDFRITSDTDVELNVKIVDPRNRNNVIKVEFTDVLGNYNINTFEMQDESDVISLSPRRASVRQYHPIPNSGMAGTIARHKLQQEMAITRTYEYKAAPTKAALIDPMDVVSLTSLFQGLNNKLVRVVSTEEQGDADGHGRSDLEISIVCEELAPSTTVVFDSGGGGSGGGTGAPKYVADRIPNIPGAPIQFSDDLQTFVPQTALETLATAAGITAYGGDLYYDGTTIISTALINPAAIAVWKAGTWTMPLVVHDTNTFIGGSGAGTTPKFQTQAIGFDGSVYAVGGTDSNGNTAIWHAADPANGPWVLVDLDGNLGFDGVQVMKWIPRLNLWIAVGEQIWSAGSGAAIWTSRLGFFNDPTGFLIGQQVFIRQLYDDGTNLWAIGHDFTLSANRIWESSDGITWTSHAWPSPFINNVGTDNIYWDAPLALWIANNENTPNRGLLWATSMLGPWTVGLSSLDSYSDVIRVGPLASPSPYIYAVGANTGSGTLKVAHSSDGKTWTVITSTPPAGFTGVINLPLGVIGAPDETSISISFFGADTPNRGIITYSTDQGATLAIKVDGFDWEHIIGPIGAGMAVGPPPSVVPPSQGSGGGPSPDPGLDPPPVNTPIFIEPHTLDPQAHTLWIGVSGQIILGEWGGANIYMSDDGGTTYTLLPVTASVAATMGVLAQTLPIGLDPDLVNTLDVDLSEMGGVLTTISTARADAGYNLAWVDGEFIAFANVGPGLVDPTNPNEFACTYLRRGLYGSTIASHAAGAPFLFLSSIEAVPSSVDPGVVRVQYPANDVGVLLYFKFTSFNSIGGTSEDLATVTAYPFTPAGP